MNIVPTLSPEQYAATHTHLHDPVQSLNIVVDVLPETEHGTDR